MSEPCEDTSTKHISKFVSFGDVIDTLKNRMQIDDMSATVDDLLERKSDRREFDEDGGVWFISETSKNPYIISSIYETNNGNISALSGYDLSAGMNEVFRTTTFDYIRVKELSVTSLSADTLSIFNTTVITAEVDLSDLTAISNMIMTDMSGKIDILERRLSALEDLLSSRTFIATEKPATT